MPSADERIAELEARVKTLETQMQDLAGVVGGVSATVEQEIGFVYTGELVWTTECHPDDDEPISMWLEPNRETANA